MTFQRAAVISIVSLVLLLACCSLCVFTDDNAGRDRRGMQETIVATTQQIRGAKVVTVHNDLNVVHVLQTRLFQFQPDLVALGQARLNIFRAFTVASVASQTWPHFLWIIRTDPDLHPVLKVGLLEAVQGYDNVVVIASNFNPEGFRDNDAVANVTRNDIWAGSWELLQAHHDAAQDKIVLESRLDADDALNVNFCRSVQERAVEQLQHEPLAFTVGCANTHVEWQQHSPWKETADKGALLGLATRQCITPGLTFAYGTLARRKDIPVAAHHKIHTTLDKCSSDETNTRCLYRLPVPGDMPVALRARTVTSAGMGGLVLHDGEQATGAYDIGGQSPWRTGQAQLWEGVRSTFGVDAEEIWNVHSYLQQHELEVAADALKGQCTKGHSCKEDSKAVLTAILETS